MSIIDEHTDNGSTDFPILGGDEPTRAQSDAWTLTQLSHILNGTDWSADTIDSVAALVRGTGRRVDDTNMSVLKDRLGVYGGAGQAQVTELREQRNTALNERDGLYADIATVRAARDALVAGRLVLEQELAAAQSRVRELQDEVAAERQHVSDLQDALHQMELERNAAQEQTDATLRSQVAVAQQQLTESQGEVGRMVGQLATQREETRRWEHRYHDANNGLITFKSQVQEIASRYAVQHGWCSVVSEALSEMGLELLPKKYSATVCITVEFVAEMSENQEIPSESWVYDSMGRDEIHRAITRSFRMDSDHDSVTVNDIEFEVTDVSEYDE